MEMRKLQKLVVSALEDIKGKNIEVINTTGLSSMFDSMIIATGDSNRQEQEAREAARRAELERDRFLLLCANALSGVLESYLSRHRSAQEQPPQAADPQAEHTAPPPTPKPKR